MFHKTKFSALLVGLIFGSFSYGLEKLPNERDDELLPGVRLRFGAKRSLMPNFSFAPVMSPNGKEIAYWVDDTHISIHDTLSGNKIRSVTIGEPMRNSGIVYSADGKRFVTLGDKDIHVWDSENGKKISSISSRENGAEGNDIKISEDGTTVSIWKNRGNQRFVKVWNLTDGNELGTIQTIHDSGMKYSLSHDGKRFATWGTEDSSKSKHENGTAVDNIVHIWDVKTSKLIHSLDTGEDSVGNVRFSPDGKYVATSDTHTAQLWDVSTGKMSRRFYCSGSAEQFRNMVFSPNSKLFSVASHGGIVQTWDTSTGKRISQCKGPIDYLGVANLHCRLDGKITAFAGIGWAMVVWEVDSGKILTPTNGHYQPAYGLQFTSDGKQLISYIRSQMIRWDIRTGLQIEPHQNSTCDSDTVIYSVSPNGKYYITKKTREPSAFLWDADVNQNILALGNQVRRVGEDGWYLFSGDSRRLLVVNRFSWPQKQAAIIKMIDLETNIPFKSTRVTDGVFCSAACSHDGTILTTCFRFPESKEGQFNELKSHDVATGALLSTIRIPDEHVFQIAYLDRSSIIVQAGKRQTYKIYDVYSGQEKTWPEMIRNVNISVLKVFVQNPMLAITLEKERSSDLDEKNKYRVVIWEVASGSIRQSVQMPGPIFSLAFSHNCNLLAAGMADTSILLYDLKKFNSVGEQKKQTCDAHWKTLEDRSARVAWEAMQAMISNPAESVTFIKARVSPVVNNKPNTAQITKWISELDSPRYSVREATMKQLEQFATEANDQIKAELANKTIPLDLRERLEKLSICFSKPPLETNVLRPLRAVEILERINTPAAREHLKTLAAGGESTVTWAARDALRRLEVK